MTSSKLVTTLTLFNLVIATIGNIVLPIYFHKGLENPINSQISANILPISIFSLADKMNNFSGTSIEKEKNFERYTGLTVISDGYVGDVSRLGDSAIVFVKGENGNDTITCIFKSEWLKTVGALSKGEKINFSGIVDRYSAIIQLRDCDLR